ncbi:Serine/threonine-protein kinase Nek10 [Apodemus speciosus]|uniref:Serine/threonine-protein kinase Nek10 n=1 Tax=Apodemus speciosus TaxID=105296 RepID=A0ABQ0FH79_APOSI
MWTTIRDYSDLKRLRCLLNVQSSKQQLPAINFDSAQNNMTKSEPTIKTGGHRARGQWHESTEAVELENFRYILEADILVGHSLYGSWLCVTMCSGHLPCINYKNERNFSKHPQHQLFQEIFMALVRNRLICREILHKLGGIEDLAQYMEVVADEYLGYAEEQHCVDKLVNMTYIFQKLAAVKDQREWVTASGAHKTLVNLLGARDTNVLLGTLLALASLAESPECREKISELNIVENLLMILHEYDLLSKRLTAELLRLLCAEPQVKEQVKLYEGIPILLSLLHSDHLKLLWSVVWILVQVCEDPETSVEIRIWGGIKQLLHILQGDRNFVSDRSSIGSLSSANAAGRIQQLHLTEDLSPVEIQENTVSLQAACCAALTELALNDTNAHQVVQENGVYTIAKLILPNKQSNAAKTNLLQLLCIQNPEVSLQYGKEQATLQKRLFPTDLFETFIDIGHYVRDISAYEDLVSQLNLLLEDELKQIAENIESINQKKAPLKYIGDYAVLDHLGSGAFGCVYKVRKRSGQNLLAMKEVNLHNPAFGKDKKDRDSSVKNIVSELTIIKEQLYHPNVVRYYKTFLENDRLYIVMELIEGAPLGEHFSSLKEKHHHFSEERLWKIFIQLCLALRYLHKEKRIVHRDLTPNNIMLGDKDKVTVTDFGLAKQKQESSKLTSVVGTIIYSCPEVLKSEPYGEKADVWAAGCILYQMIVEAVYEPVPEGIYSEKVTDTIRRCLTPDAEARPDIVEVSSMISDVMMKYLDSLSTAQLTLERKLERERRRTQRYFMEANRNAVTCHHELALLSQETFEKASLSSSSSGAASLKSELSESAELPGEGCQVSCGKEEDRLCEEVLSEDNFQLESVEKADLYSELDYEPDISDNCSSSSSSPLKESTFRHFKEKFQCFGKRKAFTGKGTSLVDQDQDQDQASAGIAVSQRKVRQICDPIQQILIQLHKVIYITQLPPALHHDLKRRVIERFKKSLFSQQSNPCNLKSEIKKLSQGSPEPIEQNFLTSDYHLLHHSRTANNWSPSDPTGPPRSLEVEEGITYEQMQTVIEEVLEESGYYNFTTKRYLLGVTLFHGGPRATQPKDESPAVEKKWSFPVKFKFCWASAIM